MLLYRRKGRNPDEFRNLTVCKRIAYATSILWLRSLLFRKTQRYSLLEDKSTVWKNTEKEMCIKWSILMQHPIVYLCFFSVMIHSTLPCFSLKHYCVWIKSLEFCMKTGGLFCYLSSLRSRFYYRSNPASETFSLACSINSSAYWKYICRTAVQ